MNIFVAYLRYCERIYDWISKKQKPYRSNTITASILTITSNVMWTDNYIKLIKDVSNRLVTIPMILNLNQLKKYFAKNTMHPSKEGYKIIANNINPYLLSKEIK